MMKRRGQVAIEFLVIIGLLTSVFLVIMYSLSRTHRGTMADVWKMEAQEVANGFGDAVDRVHLAGWGAWEVYRLPQNLPGGLNYSVTVHPHIVSISVDQYNTEFDSKILTARINGTTNGKPIRRGSVRIENRNGTLWFTWA